ncbi:hypothetical protein TheetDRAFT_3242 [Thermoanaerobacter ethanolicus JW 200]|nr:hypothetical protein TheetDRAFT_3242 [Thermoanaerobacter ethanolicus JW 200]
MDLNSYIDNMRDDIIKSVQELVKIKAYKMNRNQECLMEKVLLRHWTKL